MKHQSSKVKILIVCNELDFGGVETGILTRVRALIKFGYDFEIVCFNKLGRIGKELIDEGIVVHNLNSSPRIRDLRTSYRLAALIRKIRPDATHSITVEPNFHCMVASLMSPTGPLLAEEVGVCVKSWYARMVCRLVWKRSTKILAVSDAVKNYIVDLEGAPAERTEVIYHFVDELLYTPGVGSKTKNNDDTFVIGCVGRIALVKGHDVLIRAAAELVGAGRNILVWLIGDGPDRPLIEKLASDLNLGQHVKFEGSRGNVQEIIQEMDIFVFPSISEGFGIALLEAMACGVPVVASDTGGIREIIDHDINGFLVMPGDPLKLADQIERIMDSSDEVFREIVVNAEKTVRTKFSKELITSQLDELYSATLDFPTSHRLPTT